MVNQMKSARGNDIAYTIKTPSDIDEFKQQLSQLEETKNGIRQTHIKRTGIFNRIKTVLFRR